jgi:hypothetical protein
VSNCTWLYPPSNWAVLQLYCKLIGICKTVARPDILLYTKLQ